MQAIIIILLLINIGISATLLYEHYMRASIDDAVKMKETEEPISDNQEKSFTYEEMLDEWLNGEEGDEE